MASRVAALVACIVLLGGCASASSASSGRASASPGPAASAAQLRSLAHMAQAPSGTRHLVAGPLGLDVPRTWQARRALPNPSGDVALVYAGPLDLPSECVETAQGGVCHPWPAVTLPPGGIVVAVRLHGMPGSRPLAGGDALTVAGRVAHRIRAAADEGCRAIGGSETVDVVLAGVPGASGWVSVDACIAGADPGAAEAAFAAVIDSVTTAPDGPSPSG